MASKKGPLFELLKKQTKITDQSAMVYVRNIRRLHRLAKSKKPLSSISWLTAKLLNQVTKHAQARHLLLAGVKLLQITNTIKEAKKYKLWYEAMINASNNYKKLRTEAKLSEKERSKLGNLTYQKFKKKIRETLPRTRRLMKIDDIDLKRLLKIQVGVVLAFFTVLPLRNELANIKVTDIKPTDNLLKKDKTGYTLILNQHKTSKRIGQRVHKLNKSLASLLNRFIPEVKRLTNHGFLLTNMKGSRLTTNGLSKLIAKGTKDIFNRPITSQLIRILYAQSKITALKTTSDAQKDLGHTNLNMTLSYAKK